MGPVCQHETGVPRLGGCSQTESVAQKVVGSVTQYTQFFDLFCQSIFCTVDTGKSALVVEMHRLCCSGTFIGEFMSQHGGGSEEFWTLAVEGGDHFQIDLVERSFPIAVHQTVGGGVTLF